MRSSTPLVSGWSARQKQAKQQPPAARLPPRQNAREPVMSGARFSAQQHSQSYTAPSLLAAAVCFRCCCSSGRCRRRAGRGRCGGSSSPCPPLLHVHQLHAFAAHASRRGTLCVLPLRSPASRVARSGKSAQALCSVLPPVGGTTAPGEMERGCSGSGSPCPASHALPLRRHRPPTRSLVGVGVILMSRCREASRERGSASFPVMHVTSATRETS